MMNSTKNTYIVTKGNSGIGYHLVKRLAEVSRVIIQPIEKALFKAHQQEEIQTLSFSG